MLALSSHQRGFHSAWRGKDTRPVTMTAALGGLAACIAPDILSAGEHLRQKDYLMRSRAPLLWMLACCLKRAHARLPGDAGRLPRALKQRSSL